ncbi:MAG: long-chain fatty acid--CoA ligase [Anaerolineales bacterium]|nr:long-chain fatty acid--CoA ligase [Anaerolineales bacterium]
MVEEKPWLKFYESHVPEHLDYPDRPLPALLAGMSAKYPQHPAMIFKGRRMSYREFDQAVDRFTAALQGLGVAKGDRVAVHLPNCPQFPIAYYATLRAGGVVVPCNPIYTPRELRHQLSDSGAKVILTLSSTYPVVKQIRSETLLQRIIVARVKTYFPPLLKFLFTALMEKKLGHRLNIEGEANTQWFSDLMAGASPPPQPVQVAWDDPAVLMYTGGTTGVSKGAQLTHRNILVNAQQAVAWIGGDEAQDSTLTTLPLFHSYGMTMCMNASVAAAGNMILILDPRNLKDIFENIHKHRPVYYPGVPAMYVAINNHPDVSKYDLNSIKSCCSGAAPLPVEVQKRFQELTGARLVEGYGLSEASPVTHGNPAYGENRIGTIGLPWPDTEARIVDLETGERALAPGEVGELCVRGPQVMKGYWNMPTETANVLVPDPDGGDPWLHTGDLAAMDADGYFKIVDRKKDMILGAGGFNVYPREIEDVLYEHPKVREAAVIGVPVEDKGERVKAFVVLKQGETATEEQLIEFCRQNLAPYKVPRFVEFRDDLPKTLVGKVLRRELAEQAREKS